MSGLLIITIITLAIVSCLIIGLTIFSYYTILKSAKRLSSSGALDEEFKKEIEENKKTSKKILGITSQVLSWTVCLGLITVATISGVYRINGEQFTNHNQVSFVIATNSMEEYYDDDYKHDLLQAYMLEYGAQEEEANKKIVKEQLDVGDFARFTVIDKDENLVLFDVYGYKNTKGKIITHRLIGTTEEGDLIFRGDNAPGQDLKVKREQVLYHYQGHNAKYIGLVVLFFGSGFGIFAIVSSILVFAVSDVAIYKWEKMKNERLKQLGLYEEKPKRKKQNEEN